ncbi:hypothetical protein FRC06_006796, partial [Ceratobasidium sp. 370]
GTIISIGSLVYRLNRRKNKLQAVLSMYARAKHTNKVVHNLLHQAGFLLSYTWTADFVSILNEAKHKKAIDVAANRIIMMSHDNIRLKYLVRSQRADKQSASDNGTAITMYALPDSACAFEDPDDYGLFLRGLRTRRLEGRAPRLSWRDIMDRQRLKRVVDDYVMDTLDFLLMVPGMEKCEILKSDKLKRVPGPQQLPHGKEHRTEMYMLPTVNIDESTYGSSSQVIDSVLKYLKLTEDELTRNRLALERKIPWDGDQMTSMLCNGLQFFLNEGNNPIERLDCFSFIFGGFHCEMALGAGTFEKSRGTSSGLATFAHDVILLSRTGLNANMNKKRPDFHTCDEFLQHELEARMRGAYMLETGCSSKEELVDWVKSHTAEDILALAKKVYSNHASFSAISRLKRSESTDGLRQSTILTNTDLLCYYAYRDANKHGRIDHIEDLMPELLVFFSGSSNTNYAKENYGPAGPNATREHHQKVAPVIPYYLYNIQHVKEQIAGQSRSHIHKDPTYEKDIEALIRSHNAAQIHVEVPDRTKKLTEYAEQREVYFTGISDKCIYNDGTVPTPPLASPASHRVPQVSDTPAPQTLHEALEALELEQQATAAVVVADRSGSSGADHDDEMFGSV